jgi:hypothetical protein
LGGRFGCKRTICALQYNDDGHMQANQFGDQRRQHIVSTLSPPILDRDVLALDVTSISQALAWAGSVNASRKATTASSSFGAQSELVAAPPVMVERLTLPPMATPPQSAWTVGGIGSDDCGSEDF